MNEIKEFIEEIERAEGVQKKEVGVYFYVKPNEHVPADSLKGLYAYFYMELSRHRLVKGIHQDREDGRVTGMFVNTYADSVFEMMRYIETLVLLMDVKPRQNPYELLEFRFNEVGYDQILEKYSVFFTFLFRMKKEKTDEAKLRRMWEIHEKKFVTERESEYEEEDESGCMEEDMSGHMKEDEPEHAKGVTEDVAEYKKDSKPEPFEKIVAFSPEMSAYIAEMKQVIKTLKKIKAEHKYFDTSILLSVDEGWGKEEFIRTIIKVLEEELKIDTENISLEQREYSMIKNNQMLAYGAGLGADSMRPDLENLIIRAVDLGEAIAEFDSPKFKNDLREYAKNSRHVFNIFLIPYMDPRRLQDLEESFADVIPVRLVVVPPVSLENMVIYLKDKLAESNCYIEGDCDDFIEQWICHEKSDGMFYGYETLDKMSSELLYEKALSMQDSEENTEEMEKITGADIRRMYGDFKETKDAYELFDELVGLVDFKVKIKEIVAQIQFLKAMEAEGKAVEKPAMHMLFLGNPGTGKTSMARIVGKVFKQEGLLRKGHFMEVSGASFVHKKVGDASEKIRTTCREARGSILFVDEAYGMSVGHNSGNVSDEILPTLVAEMENNRDDLCVIFAGYEEEMEGFLNKNSGLKSRFPHVLRFPNYSKAELVEIFQRMIDGKFEYEADLKECLEAYLDEIPQQKFEAKEFSNARFIRNLYERLWGKAAYRIRMSGTDDFCIKKEDLQNVLRDDEFEEIVSEKKKRIGFIQ